MSLARPWRAESFTLRANVPTMVSPIELRYLFWLASKVWTGRGRIVEVGPWLGGTTTALAAGARANRNGNLPLVAVDNFVWREFMSERAPLGLQDGQSFQAAFEANVAGYEVEAMCRSLPDDDVDDRYAAGMRDGGVHQLFTWDGGPVELLFVDGAKSWRALRYLLEEVGPSLVDGALIVAQDYQYWGAWWVPVGLQLLGDAVRLEHVVEHNTVSFRVVGPLPTLPETVGADQADGALGEAVAHLRAVAPWAAWQVASARVRMLAHLGRAGRARPALTELDRSWPLTARDDNLRRAARWLATEHGGPTLSTARQVARRMLTFRPFATP